MDTLEHAQNAKTEKKTVAGKVLLRLFIDGSGERKLPSTGPYIIEYFNMNMVTVLILRHSHMF
jgi:hypothetical protein